MADSFKKAMKLSIEKIERNARTLKSFPHTTSNGKWCESDHGRWTGGFWIGQLWMAYLYTENPEWLRLSKYWSKRLELRKFDRSTHDMGFLFQPSFVRGYTITGRRYYLDVALNACASLASRFNAKGRFIPAWDASENPLYAGRTIVDTSMNLPILYWGSKNGGDPGWKEIADNVADTIRTHHVRHDGSTFHVVDFDPISGKPMAYTFHQGFAANSCWSRGQAWALYGFSQLYQWSGKEEDLETAQRIADYYTKNLPEDKIPYWDFLAPNVPYEPRDSSAAAIAVTGLLELDRVLGGQTAYGNTALAILESLCHSYVSFDDLSQEGILLHGAVDVPRQSCVDGSIIYGDHYFMEALLKIQRPEKWDSIMGVGNP